MDEMQRANKQGMEWKMSTDDELDRLKTEIKRLRKALAVIAGRNATSPAETARKALKPASNVDPTAGLNPNFDWGGDP